MMSYSCREGKGTLFGIKRMEHHIDLSLALRLLSQVIFNEPTKGCYRKGSIHDWDELPHFYIVGNSSQELLSDTAY